MLISRKKFPTVPDMPLLLHNLPLSKVNTFKYLGVLLAEDLAWNPHIQSICSKARQVLGLLYRRFYNYSNTDTLEKLYVSLVRPHLEYACPVWVPHTAKDIHTLESVQKLALKMATHNWNASYLELQSLINIPTLERRRLELKLCHLFKIVHNLCYILSTRHHQSQGMDCLSQPNSICSPILSATTICSYQLIRLLFCATCNLILEFPTRNL